MILDPVLILIACVFMVPVAWVLLVLRDWIMGR